MIPLKNTLVYFLDFLFPASDSLLRLEALSAGEMVRTLPGAQEIKDDRTIVLFDYKDETVRELIWELKYKGNRKIAKKFAEILVDVLKHELADRSMFENFVSPILIPMPASSRRRKEKGFNQTEILAEEVIKHLAPPSLDERWLEYAPNILEKIIHTESQARTHATKREREKNLEHSMLVSAEGAAGLKGRSIIILDDVTTSGATFAEARRALKVAGAKKMLCVALAH